MRPLNGQVRVKTEASRNWPGVREAGMVAYQAVYRTKANLLTDKINSSSAGPFQTVRHQVNGGLNEVCETTYGGVPWGSLNTGARINVGLDVINTLSEYYGFTPPIWVDNAEAVTELVPVNGQLITLIVSGKDKKLRVERVPKNKPATLFEEAM